MLCRKLNSNWKAETVRDCFRNRKIKENGGDKDGYIENPGGRWWESYEKTDKGLPDKKELSGVKVLANGKLEKKLTVQAHKFSSSAKEAIEAAGGVCEVL